MDGQLVLTKNTWKKKQFDIFITNHTLTVDIFSEKTHAFIVQNDEPNLV